ncbi:hypothetical protein AVEN_7723-1 [Araneus ventricosus]|uniref:Uncharacterized protein n=1 Tax=Araneus ventricosus TaxID=182803 RepID=A0A4Y2SG59_ARAVE|nr:hypothetical protein AVEN_7723-1 [Araneus ventricosus]
MLLAERAAARRRGQWLNVPPYGDEENPQQIEDKLPPTPPLNILILPPPPTRKRDRSSRASPLLQVATNNKLSTLAFSSWHLADERR